ncbi:MAG: hypothetical protein R3290_07360 [Acidimicrobiia bacterium]|nr:hypothetical protein [Acidimicrobiia bacterium]
MTDSATVDRPGRFAASMEGEDLLAAIAGMFTALGVLVFLQSLIAAGNASIDYQLNAVRLDGTVQEIEVVGAIVAIAVVLVSFVVGGWVAGRIAVVDGDRNGMGAALLFVLLVAVFGALGSWIGPEWNAFGNAALPDWFSQFAAADVTLKAVAAAAAGCVAALLGGAIGGGLGERFSTDPAPAAPLT